MLYQTIDTASQLREAFHHANRKDQFSYDAIGLLFDYLNDCGSDVELDVVGICCEFSEDTPESIAKQYNIDLENDGNELLNVLDSLHDMTTVVGVTSTGSIVYEQF